MILNKSALFYSNPGLWYLALFARTPHPFSSSGDWGTEQDVLNALGKVKQDNEVNWKVTDRYERAKKSFTSEQIQAIQRKRLLRPKALKLDTASETLPGLTRGQALENAYTAMRVTDAAGNNPFRESINNSRVLDRYYRQQNNQLTEAEKLLPLLTESDIAPAKKQLSTLSDREWKMLEDMNRSINEVRKGASPVEEVISNTTSPIGRGAKQATVESLKARAAKGNKAMPSYVANPESVAYAVDPALKSNRTPMRVRYNPAVANGETAIDRRLTRLANARQFLQTEQPAAINSKSTPVLPPAATSPVTASSPEIPSTPPKLPRPPRQSIRIAGTSNLSPEYQRAIIEGLIDPTQLPPDEARKLLQGTPVKPRPSNTTNTIAPDSTGLPQTPAPTEVTKKTSWRDKVSGVADRFQDWYEKQAVQPILDERAAKASSTPTPSAQNVNAPSTSASKSSPANPPAKKSWRNKRSGIYNRQWSWSRKMPTSIPNQVPVVPSPQPPTPTTQAPSSQNSSGNKKRKLKVSRSKTPPTPKTNLPKTKSAVELYQEMVDAAPEVSQPESAKRQSSKLKNLLAGFPNLNSNQKSGLLKLGAGVAGAGGILLGGSMLANNLIKQKEQEDIARQQRMYSPYPQQPPYPNTPY